jgi:hypothetical protein
MEMKMNTLKRYLGNDLAYWQIQHLKEWLSNRNNADKVVLWVVIVIAVLAFTMGGQ